MFFSFCEAWHVLPKLRMKRGIPQACLTLIYRQPIATIAAASEACGLVRCTFLYLRRRGCCPIPRLASTTKYSRLKIITVEDTDVNTYLNSTLDVQNIAIFSLSLSYNFSSKIVVMNMEEHKIQFFYCLVLLILT